MHLELALITHFVVTCSRLTIERLKQACEICLKLAIKTLGHRLDILVSFKDFTKNFQNTYVAENLLMTSSELCMVLILFEKLGKFEPCDSYKLYSYKEMCGFIFEIGNFILYF